MRTVTLGRSGDRSESDGTRHSVRCGWLLLPVLLAVVAYGPILRAGFVWDDRLAYAEAPESLDRFWMLFSPTAYRAEFEDFVSVMGPRFWPITVLSIILDKKLNRFVIDPSVGALDERRARVPHGMLLLQHGVMTLLVTALLRELLRDTERRDAGAIFGGLLFAAHPSHGGSVCFLMGRSDVLAGIFMLASILSALRYRNQRSWLAAAASAGFWGLALLSKEFALTQVAVLPFLYVLGATERRGSGKPLAIMHFVVLVIYSVLRFSPGERMVLTVPADAHVFAERLVSAVAFYIERSLVPFPPTPYAIEIPGALRTIPAIAVGLASLAGAIGLFRRGHSLPLMAVFWFLATIAPALLPAVVPGFSINPIAERYLYIPSVGIALLAAFVMEQALARPAWRVPSISVAVVLLVLGVAGCWGQTQIWQSEISFWEYVVSQPQNARHPSAWYNLGFAYEDASRRADAFRAFQQAREIPGVSATHGVSLLGIAEIVFADAVALFQASEFPAAEEKVREAESLVLEADGLGADASKVHLCLARYGLLRVYAHRLHTGKSEAADLAAIRNHLESVLRGDPTNAQARKLLRAVQVR